MGLAELGRCDHRRAAVRQARPRPRGRRAAVGAVGVLHEVATGAVPRRGGPRDGGGVRPGRLRSASRSATRHNEPVTNTQSWDRIASQRSGATPTDVVQYGPDGPTEGDVRLLGNVAGKRILDLGCGDGQAAVAFTLRGATTIAVDSSVRMLDRARTLADHAGVRVEWHQGDVPDLAFVPAEPIAIVFNAYSLGEVGDLHRVFPQEHRVPQNPG